MLYSLERNVLLELSDMGGSQSQEDRSQTFSTIGLPPASLYPSQERSQSVSIPRESSRREHLYRNNSNTRGQISSSSSNAVDDTDEWLRIERPPTRIPHPPRQPPPPAHPSHDLPPSLHSRSSRRPPIPPPQSQSLRDYEELDLEQLLTTLHSLHLSSRRNTEGSPSDPGSTERRRRHHHGSGSSRHRHRSRHHGPPFLLVRSPRNEKCPLCSKEFSVSEFEEHLASCSQRPRVQYNEDKLLSDAGECSICLEDLEAGDKIARLPCLCVYHLACLKGWYKKSQTCPEHPDMNVK